MTDAKLGHVQEMLESIPYLDCCERQQRSFGLFFFFAKWWGFYLFVGKGAVSSGVPGGQLICAFQLLIRFKLSKKESFKTPTKFIRGVLAISKVAIVGLHLHECLQAPHEIEMKLFAPFTRST